MPDPVFVAALQLPLVVAWQLLLWLQPSAPTATQCSELWGTEWILDVTLQIAVHGFF